MGRWLFGDADLDLEKERDLLRALLFTSTCEPIGELSSLFDLDAFFLEREADLLDFDLLSFERDDETLLRVEVVDDESV
jgi:hypothetical protein